MVSLRWAWAPEPASWLEGAPFLKIPRLGRRLGAEPVYPWDRFPAHPKAAMMIIKALNLTRLPIYALLSGNGLLRQACKLALRSPAWRRKYDSPR